MLRWKRSGGRGARRAALKHSRLDVAQGQAQLGQNDRSRNTMTVALHLKTGRAFRMKEAAARPCLRLAYTRAASEELLTRLGSDGGRSQAGAIQEAGT